MAMSAYGPPYLQMLKPTNKEYPYSLFIYWEKNLVYVGPVFKPVLFKGQLYIGYSGYS